MRLISIEGHFGCIKGEKIEFDPDFSHRVLPNGWGKSTVCAFLRVMLYGLDTSRRDTAANLSDKSKYAPLDGQPMSGRLTILYKGRPIVISRMTGAGGLMREFDAYYADTGAKCSLLSARNCGEVLLGIGEDGFRSSCLMDGTELLRPSKELGERILAMAQTGDVLAKGDDALKRLDRWRLDMDSGNGHGRLPVLRAELDQKREKLKQLEGMQSQADALGLERNQLQKQYEELLAQYEDAYRKSAGEKADEQERLLILQEESERRVRELTAKLPAEEVVEEASDALFGFEGAVQLEREKRQRFARESAELQERQRRLTEQEHAEEIANNLRQKPQVAWIPMLIAFLFAVAAAGIAVFEVDLGQYTQYIEYGLVTLTVIALAVSFIGSVPKRQPPAYDYEEERAKIRGQMLLLEEEQRMAAAVLAEAGDRLMTAAVRLRPTAKTAEQAANAVREARDDLQALRRENNRLQEVLHSLERVKPGDAASEDRRRALEQQRHELRRVQRAAEAARGQYERLMGQMQMLGERTELLREFQQSEEDFTDAKKQQQAILTALQVVREERAALSERVAPVIAERAAQFLRALTAGALESVRIDDTLTARAAGEDGRYLDAQRLSTGMRDQLYLAFRLAVCEAVEGEEALPLILDDPFMTFDVQRTQAGMELLRRLSEKRQVILLTGR